MSTVSRLTAVYRARRQQRMILHPRASAPKPVDSNVIMRFLTHGGAVVEVRCIDVNAHCPYRWQCLGCDDFNTAITQDLIRQYANKHADACRAMPKPEVSR